MAKLIGFVIALVVFSVWMSIVGNPHVVETVIGLILAAAIGIWAFRKVRMFESRRG